MIETAEQWQMENPLLRHTRYEASKGEISYTVSRYVLQGNRNDHECCPDMALDPSGCTFEADSPRFQALTCAFLFLVACESSLLRISTLLQYLEDHMYFDTV